MNDVTRIDVPGTDRVPRVAGFVMSAVGAIGLMPMLGPLMLALAIPAVIVAGLWWVLTRDSPPPVTHE